MKLDLVAAFDRLINERGSANILRERLALADDQHKKLHEENRDLKEANEKLLEEVAELRRQIEAHAVPEKFIEERGVLFRRHGNGEVDPDVYCINCRSAMFSPHGTFPFQCSKCRFISPFTKMDLGGILSAVRKKVSVDGGA